MKRFFLLEDDLSLINGLSFALEKQGYETHIARTLKEAAALWRDEAYDLAILDVALPGGVSLPSPRSASKKREFQHRGYGIHLRRTPAFASGGRGL